jgi:hypothetical protein
LSVDGAKRCSEFTLLETLLIAATIFKANEAIIFVSVSYDRIHYPHHLK